MIRIVLIGLVALTSFCRSGDPRTYESRMPARASDGNITGKVFYKEFGEPGRSKRILKCYLQHGYGVDKTISDPSHYDTFISAYYGPDFVNELLNVCDQVIVGVQESNVTTMMEMTIRTERFLRDNICTKNAPAGQISCAYIGHSKGGAVAYNVARRCMQQISEMGQASCRRLGEIFSAAGVIQGAMLTFTALGAHLEKKEDSQNFLTKILGGGMNLVWDVYVEYIPGKTNPIWVDLSPASPMEDGMPLYVANSVVLSKTGWLVADFASAASNFKYTGSKSEGGPDGCGEGTSLYHAGCSAFGKASSVLHGSDLQTAFNAGLEFFKKDPRFSSNVMPGYFESFSWEKQQFSDGLADSTLALQSCNQGLLVVVKPAVKRCAVIKDLNHWAAAGGGPEIRKIILEELGR